jgi:hypothetical protein
MRHFLVETYHGPLIFTERQSSWIIESPCRPPEVYRGAIPMDCLRNAVEIKEEQALRILGGNAPTYWHDNLPETRAS